MGYDKIKCQENKPTTKQHIVEIYTRLVALTKHILNWLDIQYVDIQNIYTGTTVQ